MALSLTTRAFLASRERSLEPLVILEIDGIDLIFGTTPVTTLIKYGEGFNYGENDLVYGGVKISPNSRDFISLDGTTNNITQQLLQDKGATSSISNFNIALLDKNKELSTAFIPTLNDGDLLSRSAKVYLSLQGTSHPEDSVEIFQGIVTQSQYKQGLILLTVAHPEELKRQNIYEQRQTELNGAIDSIQTTIPVNSVAGFLESLDSVTSYIQIEDEIIEIGTINTASNQFESCVRGALGTTQNTHSDDTEATSFYVLQDTAMNCALKLMLSGGPDFYVTLQAQSFVNIDEVLIDNAIQFESTNLNSQYGVSVGDLVSISGATNAENNFTDRTITSVISVGTSSYITVDGNFLIEELSGALVQFKSIYNTLPDGLGMLPSQVDVERHTDLESTYNGSFPTYTFYLRDTINGKDFIDNEIYFPSALYSLNRKGRASVGYTTPPLSLESVPTISVNNVVNLSSLSVERSTTNDFYNSIVYKYNEQLLEEGKFLAAEVIVNENSFNRLKGYKRNKTLTINSKGLRRDVTSTNIIQRAAQRLIDRYKFAAAKIKNVQIFYKDGFIIESGDVVQVNLPLTDPETGLQLNQKLFEVVNKKLNFIKGSVTLDLLDTAYELDSRFAVVSCSSLLDDASSSTRLKLQKSFGTQATQQETSKWEGLEGLKIKVFNDDFSIVEETVFIEIDPVLPETLVVNPALSFTPDSSYYVELISYDDTDLNNEAVAKNTFCYMNSIATITSAASSTVFDIDSTLDVAIGQTIRVHDQNFTRESVDNTIIDVTGNTITVQNDLGFTPLVGDLLEIMNFLDTGKGYRFV